MCSKESIVERESPSEVENDIAEILSPPPSAKPLSISSSPLPLTIQLIQLTQHAVSPV